LTKPKRKAAAAKKSAAVAGVPADKAVTPAALVETAAPAAATASAVGKDAPASRSTGDPGVLATGDDGVRAKGEGRARAVIDAVLPAVDGGRFAAKCITGEAIAVEAHCFTDGHDKLRVVLRWQSVDANDAYEVEMKPQANDRWTAEFTPPRAGRYRYTVMAWVDAFESWRRELERRDDVADICVALSVGGALIDEAVEHAMLANTDARASAAAPASAAVAADAAVLAEWSAQLRQAAGDADADAHSQKALALDAARAVLVSRYAARDLASTMARELVADRKRAGFSSWYEMFPRSAGVEPGRHGTFRDVEARLPYLADMGFDVLYFPPIHPIGRINRKGVNNTLAAMPEDVGSPWAIGAAEGGHKDILPELGSLEDFRHLVRKARGLGLEIALDIAFQCAPDHPYVKAHPQWFKHRPDGSVQYAENPPKKYQDIYPFDFETEDWRALWDELKSIVEYWIEQGIGIFRVDNPHTKPFGFWEWLINEIKRNHPEVIFLAEASARKMTSG
jgi:starch synthase (maltosyl-transferring)